jgi:hydroxylamine reductase
MAKFKPPRKSENEGKDYIMTTMFCYQCEQTAGGEGCTTMGVCGKEPQAANLMDVLVEVTKGISQYAHRAARLGQRDEQIDTFVVRSLFTTVTNVNFDDDRLLQWCRQARDIRTQAQVLYQKAATDAGETPAVLDDGPASMDLPETGDAIRSLGEQISIENRVERYGQDVAGLQELILYGLKGMAAYADHARILGVEDNDVYAFFHEALNFLADEPTDVDALVAMTLKVGEVNLTVMGMLDEANTTAYGHPEPTEVRVTPVAGKAICVSGHDLKDLEELLKQTEGTGINVYTHGEMLPANAYPGLKQYDHLVGNYGGAWQDQQREFEDFPGAILMTTNCLQKPRDSYKDRIFTCGLVGWEGVTHIEDRDFTPVIEAARRAGGFEQDAPEKRIPIGFARNAVLGVADKVVEAVKGGDIRHFFLVGGCDGARPGRNYYTELAEQIPDDCVILTLACGKFRFNKLDFGDIGGIPRLLDVGQCNDAYSAIQIALALADAFDCEVNDLPLSLILSWYEQKAVCILLTLLHLGIEDMKIGPTLPAFVGPTVLNTLVEQFGLAPISEPQADIQAALEPAGA